MVQHARRQCGQSGHSQFSVEWPVPRSEPAIDVLGLSDRFARSMFLDKVISDTISVPIPDARTRMSGPTGHALR